MLFFPLHRNTGLTRLQSEILLLFSLVPYNHVVVQHVLIVFEVYDAFFSNGSRGKEQTSKYRRMIRNFEDVLI